MPVRPDLGSAHTDLALVHTDLALVHTNSAVVHTDSAPVSLSNLLCRGRFSMTATRRFAPTWFCSFLALVLRYELQARLQAKGR
jgi:hypothetical protein